ncbi:MAG: hypothetical protein EBT37_10675, partial [Betaproteobacteria bacterium]|nr:hypothetical protein [Betaproteobacteria bacterium]
MAEEATKDSQGASYDAVFWSEPRAPASSATPPPASTMTQNPSPLLLLKDPSLLKTDALING